MIKLVMFDFDGVIVNTFSFCYEINSVGALSHEEYRKRFEGNIYETPHKDKPASVDQDFFSKYAPKLMECKPESEMIDVVKRLAQKHSLIIVSSTITSAIAPYLEAHGIRDCFKEILGSDVEKSKVKKISAALERFKVSPTEAVFVTDTLGDVREAEKCGVRSIGVTWGYHPAETLALGKPAAILDMPGQLEREIEAL